MFPEALGAPWQQVLLVVISAPVAYLALVVFSRIAGLRSFSNMTNFDLAATVAFGSMLATTIVSAKVPLLVGVTGLAFLFITQSLVARARRSGRPARILENRPLLLMYGGRMLPGNMEKAKVNAYDLHAKLRLAGVTQFDGVEAMLLETTGEVSVLLHDPDGQAIDPRLLESIEWGEAGSEN